MDAAIRAAKNLTTARRESSEAAARYSSASKELDNFRASLAQRLLGEASARYMVRGEKFATCLRFLRLSGRDCENRVKEYYSRSKDRYLSMRPPMQNLKASAEQAQQAYRDARSRYSLLKKRQQ